VSSILKALKKLEKERSSSRDGTSHIASEILQGTSPTNARPRWLVPTTTVVTIALLGALSYPLLRASRSQPKNIQTITQVQAPVLSVPKLAQPPIASVGNQPVTRLLQPPATTKRPTAATAVVGRPAAMPLPPLHQPFPAAATSPLSTPPAQTLTPGKSGTPAQETKQPPEQRGPTLAVSGIAWQKDSATRLAIVNGQPLATGTTIEGVTIEEIMQDRVKFSHNKSSFEVFLGKSGRPN